MKGKLTKGKYGNSKACQNYLKKPDKGKIFPKKAPNELFLDFKKLFNTVSIQLILLIT